MDVLQTLGIEPFLELPQHSRLAIEGDDLAIRTDRTGHGYRQATGDATGVEHLYAGREVEAFQENVCSHENSVRGFSIRNVRKGGSGIGDRRCLQRTATTPSATAARV